MCGIFGTTATGDQARRFMDFAAVCNEYRGPDATNIERHRFADGEIALGHTRLTITGDPSHGRQPCIAPESFYLVYNGEIFNFSDVHVGGLSDTERLFEVFRAGFGEKEVNALNGFFAFAAVYPVEGKVYLVRDRFGEKPLYYLKRDGEIFFSSSALALSLVDSTGELSDFREHAGGGIIFDETKPFGSIRQVPPGCYVEFSNNKIKIGQWYVPKNWGRGVDLTDFHTVVDLFEEVFVDAVRIRISDQDRIAVSLSGGLDSTLVVDTVARIGGADTEAFTLSTSDSRYNELDTVVKHARRMGVSLHQVDEPAHSADQFLRCMKVLEFPSFNFSFVGYDSYYSAVSQSGIRVILEGHGPDEYLGGYQPMHLRYLAGRLLKFRATDLGKGVRAHGKCFRSSLPRTMLSAAKVLFADLCRLKVPSGSECNKCFFETLSIPIVLRTFDRISMLNAIETRSPFMDHRLVEIGQALGDEVLFHNGLPKAIIREILKRRGFDAADFGHKVGFTADYSNLLAGLSKIHGVGISNRRDARLAAHKQSFEIAASVSSMLFSSAGRAHA